MKEKRTPLRRKSPLRMVKIRKVSKKQETLNNEMNKIKRELPDR